MESERKNDAGEIKRQGLERSMEMAKKQLNEKIAGLNDVIQGEKEMRDMWIERYEKESKERSVIESELLATKSQLKDMALNVKNNEIKNGT